MPEDYMSMLRSLPDEEAKAKGPAVGVATVDLAVTTGPPRHLASGILYGIPDKPDQIPERFYREIGFNYGRGGGSQLPNTRGYAVSNDDYKERFSSALSNYKTTRKYGGEFIYLLPALWGADGGQPESFEYPGDKGDWTRWDAFLEQTLKDIQDYGMTEGLVIDIWNEPDLSFFWGASKEQWLALWSRTFKKVKETLPSMRIAGPSISAIPTTTHEWWNDFLSECLKNDSLPDQWAWHMESGNDCDTVAGSMKTFHELLAKFNIPLDKAQDVNLNEYAVYGEQVPSAGAWWIAGLERENTRGLRGNWAIAGALHDFLAGKHLLHPIFDELLLMWFRGLLCKPNASDDKYLIEGEGYWPTAEYQVYKYYGSDMTGQRVKTTPTPDGFLDVYATRDTNIIRILAGTRSRSGNWAVEVVGLPENVQVKIRTLAFEVAGEDKFKKVDGPEHLGETTRIAENGSLRLKMEHADTTTAYAFEITLPKQ
ncbi:glycoside hydrolase family 39 [Fusarium sporotrichioides]|uniref:Glycoside hydrolase family 39 n=1 Tax=Fusarium sporotrichioides TaxID=5514 RepID=A0A395RZE1_FUSSP|nr:glycoside hydrolase family 39 [Fusarium sporotrichioides]